MTSNELLQVLRDFKYAKLVGHHFLPFNQNRPTQEALRFNEHDLAVLDPRLPIVVTHLVSGPIFNSLKVFNTKVLLMSKVFWENPSVIVVQGLEDTFKPNDFYIHGLSSIDRDPSSAYVSLNINAYKLQTTDCGQVFIADIAPSNCYVKETDLNARYPGWVDRFSLGFSMDLSPEETAALVFSKPVPLQLPDISDVTFFKA